MMSRTLLACAQSRLLWVLSLSLLLLTIKVSGQDPFSVGCFGDAEFFMFPVAADFQSADEICIQHGGRIGRITNAEEFNFVVNLRISAGITNYWLGKLSFDE